MTESLTTLQCMKRAHHFNVNISGMLVRQVEKQSLGNVKRKKKPIIKHFANFFSVNSMFQSC